MLRSKMSGDPDNRKRCSLGSIPSGWCCAVKLKSPSRDPRKKLSKVASERDDAPATLPKSRLWAYEVDDEI